MKLFLGAAPESVQIGKEYLCTGNNCNDLSGDSIDLSPPNPSGTSGPVDPDRLGFIHDPNPITHFFFIEFDKNQRKKIQNMLRMRVFVPPWARWQWNYFKWNWKLSEQPLCWGQRYHHDRGLYNNSNVTIRNGPYIQWIAREILFWKLFYILISSWVYFVWWTIQNGLNLNQLILRLVKMTYVTLKSEKSWRMELTWSLLHAEFIEISMLQQQAILSTQIRLMKVSHVQPISAMTTLQHSEIEMSTAKLVQVTLNHSMNNLPVNAIYAQTHQQVQMRLAEIQHRNWLHLERFKSCHSIWTI